jgi:NAD(P)-dependent dehydrogenase (short-subunit alcohol dehydrogenase family)
MSSISQTETGRLRASFDLTGRVAVITGGAGLLGVRHAEAIAEMGGIPILVDIDQERARSRATEIAESFDTQSLGLAADITQADSVSAVLDHILSQFGRVDILINNAANDPKMGSAGADGPHWSRFENFPIDVWERDFAVGLTGAFLCSQVIGSEMARRERGVILNIASDLGVISPDQRIYRQPGLADQQQPVKPVTYSVVKHGLIGLTKYLATYWAERGVRVNALSPGGVYNGQDESFVNRLTQLIPMGRMAGIDEYKAAVAFLVSDASSYMTGANLIIDGGRTVW